ncbi:MAG: hypothetical protein FWC73_09560 [Defluviitaleaceae bacterium]|nr:hypothetical protein [Defluviitaleaceae bacterium]
MKKRWIPVIILCIAAAFITGLNLGTSAEADHHTPALSGTTRYFNTTIAVVNADTGTIIDGSRYNYSAAIISTLGPDFELVSPAMAQTGLANGTYGAIVTFPPEVSARILSFNAHQPQRVELEFQINPDLPEREFLEVYITITELQMAINTTLASTYVSSIFRQFHEAQDQVDGVFRNTLLDLMALEYITLGDFTATLDLDEMPYIPLNPRELDVPFYMEQVAAFAEEVSSWYRNSYAMASDQYLWMREGLFSLTENFPEQEEDWIYMLTMWTGYSERYGELLEQYSEYVRLHEEALVAWHEENVAWHEALEDYQRDVAFWHEDSDFWFDDAYRWHGEYMGFLDEARDYYASLRDFRQELEDNINPLQDDLNAWKDLLIDYENWLSDRLDELIEMTEMANYQAEISNTFLDSLIAWYEDLDTNTDNLLDWKLEVSNRIGEMNNWRDEIGVVTAGVQQIIDNINTRAAALPPIPELGVDGIPPEYNISTITPPTAPPVVPALTISGWEPPTVDTTPITIPPTPPTAPSPPIPTGDPIIDAIAIDQWHDAFEQWETGLLAWHGQVGSAVTAVNTRSQSIQTAANQLSARQTQLQTYYTSIVNIRQPLYDSYNLINTWHSRLLNFHTEITAWNTRLHSHTNDMATWHGAISTFIVNVQTSQLPTIPSHINWEHIDLPDDIYLPMPGMFDRLEMIELLDWGDSLESPPSYDGTQIVDAFAVEFPLQGNAIEPMYLERPQGFTDYTVPEMVPYHGMILVDQPLSPLVGPPPRPDDFWASLDFMHGQLSSFDVGAFLSDDILRMVDQSLLAYEIFLQSVRQDISFLFQDNIWLMEDIHGEYDRHFWELRWDAISANMAEQATLQAAINYFSVARENTHADTQSRLATFAVMMPETRGAGGINQDVVDFAVMPFDFVPLALRDDATLATSFEALIANQPMANTFHRYQLIVLVALAGMTVGTAISSFVSHVNKKRQNEAEAKLYNPWQTKTGF